MFAFHSTVAVSLAFSTQFTNVADIGPAIDTTWRHRPYRK